MCHQIKSACNAPVGIAINAMYRNLFPSGARDSTICHKAVADPEFPVGGVDLMGGGAWTPEAVTFRKVCMSKRKNLNPLGGRGVRQARPLDPPMQRIILIQDVLLQEAVFKQRKTQIPGLLLTWKMSIIYLKLG